MAAASGISIRAVLSGAPDSALRAFIGEPTLSVLSAMSPELISREGLIELANGAADSIEILRRDELRSQLIGMLPIEKARELATKLRVRQLGSSLYEKLTEAASDRRNESDLQQFFGVVVSERAPGTPGETQKLIQPAYGLFSHQRRVAERALAALASYPYKTIVHMPTGAGKTRTAMHIVAECMKKNPERLVVWLAQSSELLEQAADEFEKSWSSLGSFPATVFRFWGTHSLDLNEVRSGFLVAGLAKMHALAKRDANMLMRLGDRAALTVIDEAHQAVAPTYQKIIRRLQEKKPGNALLGLTATPGRSWANIASDEPLAEFFDHQKVLLEVEGYNNPVHYLIEQGYLAMPEFRTLNVDAGFSLSKGDNIDLANQLDIPISILDRLATDDKRNIRIVTTIEDLSKRHKRIIVFTSTVEHAHLVSSVLNRRGTKSFVVTGVTDKISRERIINKFRSAAPEPLVLCNFGVLTTGFDAPKTSAALIARPTKSLVLYSQMVGRAIRGERAGGNKTAEIITVVDPQLPGFGDIADAFLNWEDVWGHGN